MWSYVAADWHDFFIAAVGASAALLGLLFVTVSINLDEILKFPHLPGRAAATLGILLTVLVVCSFGLAPTQSRQAFAWEVIVVATVAVAQALWVSVRKRRPGDPLSWTIGSLPLLLIPPLTLLGGGVSLCAGAGGGLYWLLVGTVLAFVAASVNAWVLLVEILR
jgi:hypothetical protein